ncbi:MAG: hypothetical protein C0514_07820 [Candidatus Puniceispirillum sp.]|nr:hypothetical protein [Candidatus Puniceispirillum sp.]
MRIPRENVKGKKTLKNYLKIRKVDFEERSTNSLVTYCHTLEKSHKFFFFILYVFLTHGRVFAENT